MSVTRNLCVFALFLSFHVTNKMFNSGKIRRKSVNNNCCCLSFSHGQNSWRRDYNRHAWRPCGQKHDFYKNATRAVSQKKSKDLFLKNSNSRLKIHPLQVCYRIFGNLNTSKNKIIWHFPWKRYVQSKPLVLIQYDYVLYCLYCTVYIVQWPKRRHLRNKKCTFPCKLPLVPKLIIRFIVA